jgi:hypothetical protein
MASRIRFGSSTACWEFAHHWEGYTQFIARQKVKLWYDPVEDMKRSMLARVAKFVGALPGQHLRQRLPG